MTVSHVRIKVINFSPAIRVKIDSSVNRLAREAFRRHQFFSRLKIKRRMDENKSQRFTFSDTNGTQQYHTAIR